MPLAHSTCVRGGLFLSVAAIVLFARAASLRAELPVNPLRPHNAVIVSDEPGSESDGPLDIWSQQAAGEVQPISAREDVPAPDPLSIVPTRLGQPPAATFKGPPLDTWPAGSPTHDAGHEPSLGTGHDSWVQPWFTHTDPNDPYRHSRLGRPLVGTSWLNRPWYVGAFLGGLLADDLVGDHVETNNSFFIGGRLGWDFDHYWGLEGRYAFSRPQTTDGEGNTLSEPAREYFVDVSLAYYPWGDSQWRPFASIGLGFQTFRFEDDLGENVHQSLLSVPIGVGIKLFHSPNHTLRLEAYDNIAFGDGHLRTMQNFTLAAGVEFRFGGRPTSYFPWHGSTSHW